MLEKVQHNQIICLIRRKYMGTNQITIHKGDIKQRSYIHLDVTDMNSASFRYCIRSGIDEFLYKLLIFSLCFYIGDAFSCAVSGVFHNTLILYLGP